MYGLQWTDHLDNIIRILKFHGTICNLPPVFMTTEHREKHIIAVHTDQGSQSVLCHTVTFLLNYINCGCAAEW